MDGQSCWELKWQEKVNDEGVGKWTGLEPAAMGWKVRRNFLVPGYSMEHDTQTSCVGQGGQSNISALRL